ncbi:3-hydroxyacyl-CoA dehydrogenase [Alkalihalobacillus pseudalcaliphilus]|uniref:3-hydroxyacyl-CoA dehydrogenase n=1 Tax=Alkalihalobacillus pseudalcaliphilus TaxID=79884 RepID=UPI00064DAF0E|nr:3-hydroxyacyl-CoA dehydrogenase [Alkalihalobacillus pseudalcaliphilus]KMK76878.1 3-hydroxybutyryl-CoA dehydrogenase [Alkalihalobacillus pseudalcaliphilus]
MKILVVGSGVMGTGIAYAAAISGFETTIHDVSNESLKKAESSITDLLSRQLAKGYLTEEQKAFVENHLIYETNLEKCAGDTDFVIEAVPEVKGIKQKVFEQLDRFTKKETLLATNTSTMSPTEIGSYTERPDKVIAMHFFNPVHRMKLVEIARGLETSDETVEVVKDVAIKMQKDVVVINEMPGFVTSRISSLVGNEAFNMLMEGVGTPEEIDRAIELGLNYPMGPFKLGDLVGLDTRLNNLQYLHETLGERFKPSPLLVKYVKAGRLGRKTGKGVYSYE